MPDLDKILLQTKLHQPRLPHNLVVRTRLLEVLNHAIDHQLTLVCAPAGFGKTTLISTWLERMAADQPTAAASFPTAWLSLDEDDSEINLFLRYFIAALRMIFNGACESTLALLQARQQPPNGILYATLSNELAKLPGEAILVLDDYHTVRGTEVHNLLIELARHWPRLLHLVLVSRIDPPIPLSGMRANGMLHEIRTHDLRFTPEETAAYLSQAQLVLQSQKDLHMLEERFEGWPAGLHLVALSLRSASNQESVLSALSSKNPNITGYLVDEVLTHQVPAIQTFLLKTSILDRFCASLCEAVVGDPDPAWNARACLDWIERSELFITPLDEHRVWYRYHHLFQELLQQRSSAEMRPDQVTDLHRLASVWFEEHGLLDEALHHALAAGDLDLAARQMNAGLLNVINREDRSTLEHWLGLLPEEMIQQRPELLMIRVWVLEFTWRLKQQAQVLLQIEELMDSETGAILPVDELQILRGQILVLRAQQAYFSNQTSRAIDLCRQALALLPPSWTFVRGGAMLYLGISMQASGQVLAVEQLLQDEYESYGDKSDAYALLLLRSLCFIYLNSGQLEQTKQIAQVLLQGVIRRNVAIQKNWGDWFLGLVCYQRNELEAAAQHFSQIVENRYTAQISTYRDAVAGLALIHQIKGESSEAFPVVELISQSDLEQEGREDKRTRSLRARLQLLQGDLESAGSWADTFTELPPDQPLLWLEEPQVTRARVLVARGAVTDQKLALQILDALDEIAERTHNTRYKIEILALRALALDAVAQRAVGDTGQADAVLMQALDLAPPGGFIRVFVDLGKSMQTMLRRIAKQGHFAETIRRILATFPEEDVNRIGSASPVQQMRQSARANSTLAEPLTRRELEVLTLLQEPLTIKEIAEKLYISHTTVKRHTTNIYGKLGVNRRKDATARALELKILSTD
jgi:ATP/maltotriose-dependent transcriptional regulator MalT